MAHISTSFDENSKTNPTTAGLAQTGYLNSLDDVDFWKLDLGPGTYTISVLPDLIQLTYPQSIASFFGFPADTPLLTAETDLSANLYERVVQQDGTSAYALVTSLASKADTNAAAGRQLLNGITPTFDSSSVTLKGASGPDASGITHTGEYYVEVTGNPIPNLAIGTTIESNYTEEAGRYLITVGDPTGQRTSQWGFSWIDTVDVTVGNSNPGDPNPPGGGSDNPEAAAIQASIDASETALQARDIEQHQKEVQVQILTDQMAELANRISDEQSIEYREIGLGALQAVVVAGDLAAGYLTVVEGVPLGISKAEKILIGITGHARDAVGLLQAAYQHYTAKDGSDYYELMQKTSDFLVGFVPSKVAMKDLYNAFGVAKDGLEVVHTTQDVIVARQNIALFRQQMQDLEAKRDTLNADLHHDSPQSMTIQSETYGASITAGQSTMSFLTGDGTTANLTGSQGRIVMFTGDHQGVTVGGADQLVDGENSSRDYVTFGGSSTGFHVKTVGEHAMIEDSQGHDIFVQSVAAVRFSDQVLRLDMDGADGAGAAYRIYQAAFDRTPDKGGLTYWVEKADANMSTIEMAARFIDSAEFRSLYGSSNPPADQFIGLIYQNVLHRTPDTGGHDYWAGQLAGGMSEAEVLARFADSAENRVNVVGSTDDGIWVNTAGHY